MSVLLCGATGLVGSECLKLLADDSSFERVTVLTRRPLPPDLPRPSTHRKIEERIVDFGRLTAADGPSAGSAGADRPGPLPAADRVICALGTTMRKAGSGERFREVDFGYPAAIARLAVERGARHFLLVSAVGAGPGSWIFYNRVKGELEDAVRALPYRSVTIVRPSLLLGERDELRLGEEIGKRLGFLAPPRYRPVQAAAVAAALVHAAKEDRPGHRIIESERIPTLAQRYRAPRLTPIA